MITHIKRHTLEYSFIVGTLLLLVVVGYITMTAAEEWNTFSTLHECKVVEQRSGDTFTAVTTNGTVAIGSSSSQTAYLCDDNITYWR